METKKINRKIMAVIKSDKGNFILLRTNPKFMKEDIWFVVTGSLKSGETPEEAVRREVKEETNLEIIKIIPTNYSCEYEWPKDSGNMHYEQAFLVIVNEDCPKITSFEHLEYKWLNKKDFLNLIGWKDSKKRLIEILNADKNNVISH